MKIKEILKEYRLPFDITGYGCWYNTKTKETLDVISRMGISLNARTFRNLNNSKY